MFDSNRSVPLYESVLSLLVASGLFIILFDIAKKTVFLGASWNYDYPPRTLQYNVTATVLLIAASALVVALYYRLEDFSPQQFAAGLAGVGGILYGLSFFMLPGQTAYHALTPGKGMYCASLTFTDKGLLYYFSHFHEIGHCQQNLDPRGIAERVRTIERASRTLESLFLQAHWFPWHESWAELVGRIEAWKHGPIPPLVAGLIMTVLGDNIANAVVGNYIVAALLPVAGYALFRTRFSEELSRFGAAALLFSPGLFYYARNHTVAYDMYTALFTVLCMFLLVRAVDSRRTSYAIAAGMAFSLAVLSKVTVTLFGLSVLLFVVLTHNGVRTTVRRLAEFGMGALAVPVVLMAAGYNIVLQYLFQYAMYLQDVADKDTGLLVVQKPNPDLGDPILNFLARAYHFRLIGYAILIFATVAVVYFLTRRYDVTDRSRYVYGFVFSLPVLYFLLTNFGLNLARQLLPYNAGIWFVALAGLDDVVQDQSRRRRYILYVTTLALTAGTAIVNI